jgi:Tfp pilus assembly protein PilF
MRAIEWLERANQLNGGRNYWYQFLLGYLEDKAGYTDDAFRNYSVAAALRPDSPWLLFSLARIYRARGHWYWARKNIDAALELLEGKPEATQVRLERGYLYQQVGDFSNARHEYTRIIADNGSGIYGRAARLNSANIDAESGSPERARQAYDALILEDLTDTAARKSRALLELRLGEAERAAIDLTALLEGKARIKNRDELLAQRALSFLLLGKAAQAVSDAAEAQRLRPSAAHERLRQRALLAAHQAASLQLERPEELMIFPLGGDRLRLDLRAAAIALERRAQAQPDATVRAALNQAVIYAALGERNQAVAAATHALEVSPHSVRAFLIRARVHYFAGERSSAWADVNHGLQIQPTDPGLLELRGLLQAASGDAQAALESYTQASHWGSLGQIHLHKAAAEEALGRDTVALREWSLALRSDPELPEAYLGRARLAIRFKDWDLALADLEHAAAWAQADPRTELAIVGAYLRCLPTHPNHIGRWLVLATRTIHDGRRLLLR